MLIAKFHFKRSFNLRFQNTLKTYTSSFFFPLVLAIHLNALDGHNVQQPPKRDVAKFETIRSPLSSIIVQTPNRLHFEFPSCPLTCYYPGLTSVFQRELLWHVRNTSNSVYKLGSFCRIGVRTNLSWLFRPKLPHNSPTAADLTI